MSRFHQFTLPATVDHSDVLGGYGQHLCFATSHEFAVQIADALNTAADLSRQVAVLTAELDRLKAEVEAAIEALKREPVIYNIVFHNGPTIKTLAYCDADIAHWLDGKRAYIDGVGSLVGNNTGWVMPQTAIKQLEAFAALEPTKGE